MINLNACIEYYVECDRCQEYVPSMYSTDGVTETMVREGLTKGGWLLDRGGKGKALCPKCVKNEKKRMVCTNCGSEFWGEHILYDEIKGSGICPVCRQSENLREVSYTSYPKINTNRG